MKNKIKNLNKGIIPMFILIIFIFYIFYSIHNSLKHNNIVYIENFDNEFEQYNKIPKIIIHTWKTKMIPSKYKKDFASCKKHNPEDEYEYRFYSDEDIDDFLSESYPEWFVTYNKFPVKIQKIDFFRYVAIYHFGGFYLDLDILVYKNFNDLLDYECIFPIDQRIDCTHEHPNNRFKKICNKDPSLSIILGQYAFAAKKNNLFIKFLIDNIHNNIDNIIELHKYDQSKNYIYQTTGPDYVTDMYIEYSRNNNVEDEIHILPSNSGQQFGEYGKHHFYGTWKKGSFT